MHDVAMRTQTAETIYVRCQGVDNEFVTVSTEDLPENPYDLVYLLKLETAPRSCWRDVSTAYFRKQKWEAAITVLEQATSDDVENVLRGGVDDEQVATDGTTSPCSRLDLLAALGGAYIMMAESSVHDPDRRADALRKAAEVFSRADKIDLDDPSIWTARGWSEFHTGKSGAANWFDNARDKNVVLGAVGLAAFHLNRSKPSDPSRKDPVSLLVTALRSDICPPGVWTGLAYALYKEGHIQSARNVARRALAALAKSPPEERLETLYLLAMVELADKSEDSVESMMIVLREAYLKCGGDQDTRILSLLAGVYFNSGDFEKAEQFALLAVEAADLLPSMSVGALFVGIQSFAKIDALFQLARVQHHLQKNEEAMRSFMQIKKMADASDAIQAKINPGLYLRLGLLKLSTGRREDEPLAKECLEKTLKLSNDRNNTAKRALGVLIGREVLIGLRKGRPRGGETYERAVSLLEKGMSEMNAGDCDVPAQLVYAALVEEYYPQKALHAYQKAVKALEDNKEEVESEIWNNYASLLTRCGDINEADKLYRTKIDEAFAKDCASVEYNRGRIAEMCGNVEGAEKIFRSLAKGHVHYFESIVRLAVMAMRKADSAEVAERLLKEAKEAPATRTTAIVHLSALYVLQKNYKEAQEVLEVSRNECDYLSLLFSSFMHRFLDSLDQERRGRFLVNHIGTPLISILKRNHHNVCAANGVGVYFAESKMLAEARDAFTAAGTGPRADVVSRVNLAHIQIQMGMRDLKESAKITGRPSLRARSQARSLFEQSYKLYNDAMNSSSVKSLKGDTNPYCELLLYSAWAQFEARDFRKSADTLQRLLHVMPSCFVAWFNLAHALMESAMDRVLGGTDRLEELEMAKREFQTSRTALTRFSLWKRPHPDSIGRVLVSSRHAYDLDMYIKQEAKSHDVKVRNAINKEEDRKDRLAAKSRELEAHAEKQRAKARHKQEEKYRKEMELRQAFEQSQQKQRENEENNQRILAAKKMAANEDDYSGDEEGGGGGGEKKRSKRKRKDVDDDREGKKSKRGRKSVKKVENEGSGDEYSDTPEDEDDVGANGGADFGGSGDDHSTGKKRDEPDEDRDNSDGVAQPKQRKLSPTSDDESGSNQVDSQKQDEPVDERGGKKDGTERKSRTVSNDVSDDDSGGSGGDDD